MTIDTAELRRVATACDVKQCADESEWDRRFKEFLSECDPDVTLVLLNELDQARARIAQLEADQDAMRKDALRYRFVSQLAWYVSAAAQIYNVCNVNAQWSDQRGHPDTDDIEAAIDTTMAEISDPTPESLA